MDLIYISHPSVETLYPLTVEKKPVSSLHLIGKPLLKHIYENAIGSSIENLIHYVYDSSLFSKTTFSDNLIIEECVHLKKCFEQTSNILHENEHVLLWLGTTLPSSEKVFDSILARWNEVGGDILLVLTPGFTVPETRGVISLRVSVDLDSPEIKPHGLTSNEEKGGYNFTGIMIVRTSLIGELLGSLKEFAQRPETLLSVIRRFLDRLNIVATYHILTLPVYPVNTPWNFLFATREILEKINGQRISSEAKVSPRATIEGPVIIEKDAVIDHGAVIKGPVYIGRNVLVGANSFVRHHVSVEENSIVGALSEVKRSYLGRRTTIASHSHITDSLVGDDSTIRPMSVTLNYEPHYRLESREYSKRGSIIGENSIVDGGSVLRPATIVKPSSVYRQQCRKESD